jgi:diadenylate cyclase
MTARPTLHDVLERLAPGTPLRQAVERIIQQRNGALVILGFNAGVAELCSGGFELSDSAFTPARLAELAKMDGAIIIDDSFGHILRANVHLLPNPKYGTDETGARHRTAERTAQQTGKPVLSVSEDRRMATLFIDGTKHELLSPTLVAAKVNQSLQTLDRFRRRLEDAQEILTRSEIADLVTYRTVLTVLQRSELVHRIGQEIKQDAVGLGDEGSLIVLQIADLIHGVDELRELILADYVRPNRANVIRRTLHDLEAIPTADLTSAERVAEALGFDQPDQQAEARGVRLLSHVPRLPDSVRASIVRHFRDLQRLLAASAADLERVEGVGAARAEQIRRFFDRMVDRTQMWQSTSLD